MVKSTEITLESELSTDASSDSEEHSSPDIKTPVAYTSAIQNLIKNLLEDQNFTHENWNDDNLKEYRKLVRDYYRTAQSGLCAFCKNDISLVAAENCHIEHIVPKSKYKRYIFEPKNLCVICADCNIIKRAKDVNPPEVLSSKKPIKLYPRSSKAFLIVHPHFDKWDEHLVKFGTLYADLTEKGLITMSVCTLNRKLRKFGWEAVVTSEADIRQAAKEVSEARDGVVMRRKLTALLRLAATT